MPDLTTTTSTVDPIRVLHPIPVLDPVTKAPVQPTIFHLNGSGFGTILVSAAQVSYYPSQLDFGDVSGLVSQTVTVQPPTTSAKVSASVLNDAAGAFSANFVTTLTLTKELNGKSYSQTETVALPNPTSVNELGKPLLINVKFGPPAGATSCTAQLVVQGDGWETITVPLSGGAAAPQPVAPAQGTVTAVVSGPCTIRQAEPAIMDIQLTSTLSSAAEVTLTFVQNLANTTGLSMDPVTTLLEPNSTATVSVNFHADSDAWLVTASPIYIYGAVVENGLTSQTFSIPATITVTPGAVYFIRDSGTYTITYGQNSFQIEDFLVTLTGSATDINIWIDGMPTGVSCPPFLVSLPGDQIQTVPATFYTMQDAPIQTSPVQLTLSWSAYDGVVTGSVQWDILVASPFFIQQQGTPFWCWAAVTASISAWYQPATTWTQCQLAQLFFDQLNPDNLLTTADCCATPTPDSCAQPFSVEAALRLVNHWTSTFTVPTVDFANSIGPISLETIEIETGQGRPVAIRIQWGDDPSGDPAHAVVLSAVDSDDLIVMNNPNWGNGNETAMEYATLVNSFPGFGIWTDAYLTQP